jgi:hypothetical protein
MQRKNMVFLISAVLLFAISVPTFAAPKEKSCFAIVVGSQEKAKGKFDTLFSATQILDLDFTVLLNPGSAKQFLGTHYAEFRVYTPKGHLYQSISIPFSADPKLKGNEVAVPGYPRPIATRSTAEASFNNAKFLAISARMPVGGTSIVQNSLYGEWRLEALLDDDSAPCSAAAHFAVTE